MWTRPLHSARIWIQLGASGRFSICILVRTCVLAYLIDVISLRPSTVPIPSTLSLLSLRNGLRHIRPFNDAIYGSLEPLILFSNIKDQRTTATVRQEVRKTQNDDGKKINKRKEKRQKSFQMSCTSFFLNGCSVRFL